MRVAGLILSAVLAAGCRQLFGIDDTAVAGDGPIVDDPDAPVVADAPIDAPPDAMPPPDAAPVTLAFRNGSNGYSGTLDTDIDESLPNDTAGTSTDIDWDINTDDTLVYGLIQFTAIFGPGVDQIPPGSAIAQASLEVDVVMGTNDPGEVADVAVPWDEDTTWDTFGPVPGVQLGDAGPVVAATPLGSGPAILDVTASVARWSADPALAHGWIFAAGGGEDAAFASSEANSNLRPRLVVTFVPP